MAERVTITIDVDAKTAGITKTIAQLKTLDATVNRLDKRTKALNGSMNSQDKSLKNLNKKFDKYNDNIIRAANSSRRLHGVARALLFTVVGLGIEFAAVALSLVSVNAAFNVGKLLVKGYHGAMAGLSGVIAAVGVGLATVAAAQREYNASLYAYRMKSFPALGKGLQQSMAMMRSLTSDATMASFGVQALNQAFMNVSKSSEFTGRSLQVLRALADFAYAGGDPAKNIAAAAEFVGVLQKQGKVTAEVSAAAAAMGPEFEKSFKKMSSGKKTAEDIFSLITSGKLAKQAGVFGQADVVTNTLFGTFKTSMTRIISLFADFGQQFLEPVRTSLLTVERMFERTFAKIGPEMKAFGEGPLLRMFVNGAENILNLSVTLFRRYLPLLDGFGSKVVKFADDFARSFRQLRDNLDSLRGGGSIVIQTFGKPLSELFKGLGRNIRSFANMAEENKPQFLAFGESLKNLVANILDFADAFKEAFTKALPVISKIIDGISMIVSLITNMMRALAGLGSVGALGVVGLAGFGVAKGRRNARARGNPRYNNPKGLANQAFYENVNANKITMLPRGDSRSAQFIGNNFPFLGNFMDPDDVKYSYKDLSAEAKRMRESGIKVGRTAPLKAYMKQNTSAMQIGGALAMAELGPMLFGESSRTPMLAGSALMGLGFGKTGAAVGLLGSAYNARTQKGGAFTGAAGGALVGAKLGSVIPGIGTAAGAVVGTVVGAAIGIIRGREFQQKLAKEAGKKVEANALARVASAMVAGDTGRTRAVLKQVSSEAMRYQTADDAGRRSIIKSLQESGILTPKEAEKASKHLTDFGKGFKDLQGNLGKAIEGPLKNFDELITGLGGASGKSREEIVELARKMNVDLYNPTLKLQDAIEQLGIGMVKTSQELNTALRDVMINSMNVFDQIIEREQAASALAQAGEKFRTGAVGDFTKEDFFDLLKTSVSTLTQRYPNDPLAVLGAITTSFGSATGTAFTTPGSPLARAGMYEQFVNTGGAAGLQEYVRTVAPQAAGAVFSNIGAKLAQQNMMFSDPAMLTALSSQLGGMATTDPSRFLAVMEGLKNFSPDTTSKAATESSLFNYLKLLGFNIDGMDIRGSFAGQNALTDPELSKLQSSILDAVATGFDEKPEWWEGKPDWWSGVMKDTSTPRANIVGDTTSSRLDRTMSRHNYFNSMIPGKRTVTSSWRNWGLGSSNSDHVTGNAYDLTGNNLGLYSSMINKAGGFAEFHGTGGARHLHVVPPMSPAGDTSNPVKIGPTSMRGGSASGGSSGVTVNVYGTEGQSVRELARVVVEEINKSQRSAKERK